MAAAFAFPGPPRVAAPIVLPVALVVAPRPAFARSFARFAARFLSSSRCAAVFFACASASSRSRSRNDGIAAGVPALPAPRPVAQPRRDGPRLVAGNAERKGVEGTEKKTVGGSMVGRSGVWV